MFKKLVIAASLIGLTTTAALAGPVGFGPALLLPKVVTVVSVATAPVTLALKATLKTYRSVRTFWVDRLIVR